MRSNEVKKQHLIVFVLIMSSSISSSTSGETRGEGDLRHRWSGWCVIMDALRSGAARVEQVGEDWGESGVGGIRVGRARVSLMRSGHSSIFNRVSFLG